MEPDIQALKVEFAATVMNAVQSAMNNGLDDDSVLGILDKAKHGIHYPYYKSMDRAQEDMGNN